MSDRDFFSQWHLWAGADWEISQEGTFEMVIGFETRLVVWANMNDKTCRLNFEGAHRVLRV